MRAIKSKTGGNLKWIPAATTELTASARLDFRQKALPISPRTSLDKSDMAWCEAESAIMRKLDSSRCEREIDYACTREAQLHNSI